MEAAIIRAMNKRWLIPVSALIVLASVTWFMALPVGHSPVSRMFDVLVTLTGFLGIMFSAFFLNSLQRIFLVLFVVVMWLALLHFEPSAAHYYRVLILLFVVVNLVVPLVNLRGGYGVKRGK